MTVDDQSKTINVTFNIKVNNTEREITFAVPSDEDGSIHIQGIYVKWTHLEDALDYKQLNEENND